ncbi:hypothetical protein WJU16_15760 [Chitinophaga pollutisoli]|uniref:Lipocalin-like domain-containing protein n=1 Tax=Chitinophaga pollutisoli TaxID=3133966 RepID=A0ABZ2YIM9_9BACT
MKNTLITCTLVAATFLGACKKSKDDPSIQFNGEATVVSGEWMMNGVVPNPEEPRSAIVPKYQFGTNLRYTHTSGLYISPKTERGEYFVVERPPIGLYVLVMKPDNAAEYNIELRIMPDNAAMFGAQMYFRKK